MVRKKTGLRSARGKEVEVVSDYMEKLSMYCKPVSLYNILNTRSRANPSFIPERLSYIIQAKKNNKTTTSDVEVTFNYMDRNNKMQRAEVVENFSCPFCSMKCGSIEGLKFHLTSSHDLFEFNFGLSEKDPLEIDVIVKPDAFRSGELNMGLEKIPYTFFGSKSRKRLQSNNMKRLDKRLLTMGIQDLPRGTENESSHVNDDNVSSRTRAHCSEKIRDIPTITQPEIAQYFEPKVPRASRRKKLSAERSEDKRVDRLKKRQFYHSQTLQPMSYEHVMSGMDSEAEDDDLADNEERMKLDRLMDTSEEDKRLMWLWNTFVRKQRVVADKHVPWACEKFVKLHVKELINPHAFGKWRLFLIKLWNHGLVCAKTIDKCNTFLHNSAAEAAAEAAAAAAAEEEEAEAAAGASTSQATTANGDEQQAPMELDEV